MSPMVESQIEGALRALCPGGKAESWDRGRRARDVKLAVGEIGKRLGCQVYSRAHPDRGEWIWDMTWIRGKDGLEEEIVLALESEWGSPQEIFNDFQKLMPARPSHRVMVFQAASSSAAEKMTKGLLEEVSRYRGKRPGDRYLFACWLESNEFWFYRHVV